MKLKKQTRYDSKPVPTAWTEMLAGLFRRDGSAEDSSESSRRAMIQRMWKRDKEAATAERAKIQKDYNGARRS